MTFRQRKKGKLARDFAAEKKGTGPNRHNSELRNQSLAPREKVSSTRKQKSILQKKKKGGQKSFLPREPGGFLSRRKKNSLNPYKGKHPKKTGPANPGKNLETRKSTHLHRNWATSQPSSPEKKRRGKSEADNRFGEEKCMFSTCTGACGSKNKNDKMGRGDDHAYFGKKENQTPAQRKKVFHPLSTGDGELKEPFSWDS